jgi:hypothetical protein
MRVRGFFRSCDSEASRSRYARGGRDPLTPESSPYISVVLERSAVGISYSSSMWLLYQLSHAALKELVDTHERRMNKPTVVAEPHA